MGFFDLPAPLFDLIEGAISFLPVLIRLILWSVIAGVASMLLYGLMSPQKRIASVKVALKKAQNELANADESFDELMGLVKQSLTLSLKHLGLVFGPALISAIPMISIMAWASNQYGYDFPAAGAPVNFSVQPETAAATLRWHPADALLDAPISEAAGSWTIAWPAPGQTLTLTDAEAGQILQLPHAAPIPQVHKKLWWNALLGNPAGYLEPESPVEVTFLEMPGKSYLPFGPGWLGHWLTIFLLASVCAALLAKRIFKIH